MKLNTIATIFKRNKRLTIFTTPNEEQWISNGIVMYSMSGMPKMSIEVILRIFNIPPDKHKDWICDESEMPTIIDYGDNSREEVAIEPLKINLEWFGEDYWLFPDKQKIYSFNEDYIRPLLDEKDYLTFCKRETESGGFVLVCKIGFEIKAIIAPSALHENREYTDEIRLIAKLYTSMQKEKVVNTAYEIFGISSGSTSTMADEEEANETMNSQMRL